MYTEKNNKIEVSNNVDKKLQTFDRVTLYTYGVIVTTVCKGEMLNGVFNIE